MKTTDIWFVSWLEVVKDLSFSSFEKLDHRRLKYHYDIEPNEWTELKMEFYKSDISKIKMAQERLKDLKH